MSARRNPLEEIERLFDRMSRQFEDASRPWETENPLAPLSSGLRPTSVDVVERDEEFVVTVDLPGYDRDDVHLEVTDDRLRVEAERDATVDEGAEGRYVRRERRRESVQRSLRLPDRVDVENVVGRMRNGVLTVTLPKRAIGTARSIEVE